MTHLDETFLQLTVGYDDLLRLASVHAGTLAPGDVPARLRDAGLVGPTGVQATAAELVEVAVAPARSIVVERFDGTTMSPMFVGWVPDGRAATSAPNADGDVVVTGTELSLLRDQLRQWLVLFDRRVEGERTTISTDTRVIDEAFAGGGAPGTDDESLEEIIDHWQLAWRANANWAQRPIDATLTVVDAGPRGWYRVDHPPREGDEVVAVSLVPIELVELISALGDVVTGRDRVTTDG